MVLRPDAGVAGRLSLLEGSACPVHIMHLLCVLSRQVVIAERQRLRLRTCGAPDRRRFDRRFGHATDAGRPDQPHAPTGAPTVRAGAMFPPSGAMGDRTGDVVHR